MKAEMKINPKKKTQADLDIFDDIGEWTDFWTGEKLGIGANQIASFLKEHDGIDTINVRIDSYGGDVFEGIAILNLLKGSGKTINVEIVGIAASIASVIATAGHVTMYPTSMMMVHHCYTYGHGNAKEFRQLAEQLDKIMQASRIAYREKAGDKLSDEKLEEILDAETYLTAEECKELGFCDEIVGKEDEPDPDQDPEEDPKPEEKLKPKEKIDIKPRAKTPWFFY